MTGNIILSPQPELVPVEHRGMMALAEMLSKSNLVPQLNKEQRYNAADIFVLASIGASIGISPLAAITGIYIVKGRPFISARLQRGLLLKNGHSFKVTEWTAKEIKVVAARKGEEPQEFGYTIAEAQHAGALKKDTWALYPRRMLLAAVTRNVVDALFSDLFLGVTTDDGTDTNIGDYGADSELLTDKMAERTTSKNTLTLQSINKVTDDNHTQPTDDGIQTTPSTSSERPESSAQQDSVSLPKQASE